MRDRQAGFATAPRSGLRRGLMLLLRELPSWLLIVPSILFFVIFQWQPLLSGLYLSFQRTKGYNAVGFAGLDNYRDVITNSLFSQLVVNTLEYVGWSIVIGFAIPIVVAIMINEMVRLKSFFKFAVYFPTMVPGIAAALMWMFMFDPGQGGLLNMLLDKLGMQTSVWLQNSHLTILLIVITMTWRGFGGTVILYLASLQGVNTELYEAASIDGATVRKRLWHITLPQIAPIISILLVLQIIGVFQVMYEPLTMTEGGPSNSSMSLMLQSYFYAFRYFEAGRSLALGVITFIILMVFTLVYFKLNKKLNVDG